MCLIVNAVCFIVRTKVYGVFSGVSAMCFIGSQFAFKNQRFAWEAHDRMGSRLRSGTQEEGRSYDRAHTQGWFFTAKHTETGPVLRWGTYPGSGEGRWRVLDRKSDLQLTPLIDSNMLYS